MRSRLVTFTLLCKDHDQKQLGEERIYLTLQLTVHPERRSREELKAGTEARPWRSVGYWLALYVLLCRFLKQLITGMPLCLPKFLNFAKLSYLFGVLLNLETISHSCTL